MRCALNFPMHVICFHLNLVKRLASGLRQYITSMMLAWVRLQRHLQQSSKRPMPPKSRRYKRRSKRRLTSSRRKLTQKTLAGAGDGEKTQLTFKINKQEGVITGYEIPEGYELRLDRGLAIALKTPAHIYASNLNEFAWVSCDLVSETLIGEKAVRLLTPSPVKFSTDNNLNKEYVNLEISRFSMIELRMFSNLKTMEFLDLPYNLLVVLHFKPFHKRKGLIKNGDGNCKKHCPDGCGGRILQQTSDWRRDASNAWLSG